MIDIFARARAFALREQEARDASEWDVEHNFSHFFDDDWEDDSSQTPQT